MLLLTSLMATPGTALCAAEGGRPVVVAQAKLSELAPFNWYTGTVISREQARLAAEVSGRLLWVAEIGTRVGKDEVVARIDDALLREELAERQADVSRIEARLVFLRQESSRLQRLAKQNNAAQSQLEKMLSDQASARSELTAAQARARRTAEQLKRTSLRAPFPGVVTERLLKSGEWADEGATVVTMTDPDLLEVQSWVSVFALPFIQPRQTLQLEIQGQRYSGRVRTLVPVSDMRSRLYELRVGLPGQRWHVGTSVRIAVPAAEAKKVLAVPRDALVIRRGSISLYKVNSDNIAERVEVTTGIASGDYIEVHGDVQPGDRVVIRGGERLRDGQRVSILKQDTMP